MVHACVWFCSMCFFICLVALLDIQNSLYFSMYLFGHTGQTKQHLKNVLHSWPHSHCATIFWKSMRLASDKATLNMSNPSFIGTFFKQLSNSCFTAASDFFFFFFKHVFAGLALARLLFAFFFKMICSISGIISDKDNINVLWPGRNLKVSRSLYVSLWLHSNWFTNSLFWSKNVSIASTLISSKFFRLCKMLYPELINRDFTQVGKFSLYFFL